MFFQTINPFRIKTSTEDASITFPVMVVTRQAKAVAAWSVPMLIETTIDTPDLPFNCVSKIMCHDSMDQIVNHGNIILVIDSVFTR